MKLHSSNILRVPLRKKRSIPLEFNHQGLKAFLIFSLTVFILLLISLNPANAIQEASSGFTWPLPYAFSNNGGYTFLQDATYSGGTVKHPGQDWNVPNSPGGSCDGDKGLDVVSVADGEVVYANTSTWGGIVVKHIYNGQTWYSHYGHIQNAVVSIGDKAYKGHKIAEIGNVGTPCAHLHFEIRQSDHPNPTNGPYWTYGSAGLANIDNVNNWYKDPDTFIPEHPAYSGSGSTDKPDLVVKEVILSKTTLAPGESFRIGTRIKNVGNADVNSSFKIKYLLSNGKGIDSNPVTLAEDSISSLVKGDSKWKDATVNAPTNPGAYNITVRADSSKVIDESDESNNYFDPPVVITVAIPNAIPEGSFDAADCTSIRGWARDPDTTNPINVHLYADGPSGSGTFVAQVLADVYRPDLPFADKNHGFGFPLPVSLKDGRDHSIYVYAIDSAGGMNPLLNGSPKNIKCDKPVVIMPNAIPEGSLDAADCTSIRGWARDPDTTNPINVHIYADGQAGSGTFVAQVLADVNRGDLPFADKNHGFGFPLPVSLKDGRDHSLYVYAIDSAGGINPLLNGSPKNIKCVNPAVIMIITDLILNGDDYNISTSADISNGTVTCKPKNVGYAGNIVCTITPVAGYDLLSLSDNNTDVTLSVAGNSYYLFNVTSNHSISAVFQPILPVKRMTGLSKTYHTTLQDAANHASNSDIIQGQAIEFSESLDFNLNTNFILKGGYSSDFSSQAGYTTVKGTLTVSKSVVTADMIIIK